MLQFMRLKNIGHDLATEEPPPPLCSKQQSVILLSAFLKCKSSKKSFKNNLVKTHLLTKYDLKLFIELLGEAH